jgi:hypothetical protein
MEEVGLIAAHMLADIKAYGDGVGFGSQILCLHHNGSYEMFPKGKLSFREIEEDYEYWKSQLRNCQLSFADRATSDTTFEGRLTRAVENLVKRKRKRTDAHAMEYNALNDPQRI